MPVHLESRAIVAAVQHGIDVGAYPGAVLLVAAAPERVRSADVLHPYRQDSDFGYVTGFAEPDAVAVLAPGALLPVAVVWLACVMLTGFVGLGTMLGTAALPAYFMLAEPPSPALVAFGIAMTGFVIYTHRANIARLRAGTEPRIGAKSDGAEAAPTPEPTAES